MGYRKCDFCPNNQKSGVPILKLTPQMKRTWKLDESRTFYLCLSEEHFKLGVSNHIKGECINGRGKWKPNTELSLYIFESLQRLDSFQSDSSSSDGYDYRTEIILDNIGNGFGEGAFANAEGTLFT